MQGNYNGFQIWDISNPAAPRLRLATVCPASQSDVSVWKNLLFVSAEAPTARLDCGKDAPREAVSKDRIRGVRIFDDLRHRSSEVSRERSDLPWFPRRTRSSTIRTTKPTSTSISPARRRFVRPRNSRAATTTRGIRTTRISELKSSRFRSRIRSRPRSSARLRSSRTPLLATPSSTRQATAHRPPTRRRTAHAHSSTPHAQSSHQPVRRLRIPRAATHRLKHSLRSTG